MEQPPAGQIIFGLYVRRKKPQEPVAEFNQNLDAPVFNFMLVYSDIKLVHVGGQDKFRRKYISPHQGVKICGNEMVKSLADNLSGILAEIFLLCAAAGSFFAVDQNLI